MSHRYKIYLPYSISDDSISNFPISFLSSKPDDIKEGFEVLIPTSKQLYPDDKPIHKSLKDSIIEEIKKNEATGDIKSYFNIIILRSKLHDITKDLLNAKTLNNVLKLFKFKTKSFRTTPEIVKHKNLLKKSISAFLIKMKPIEKFQTNLQSLRNL